MVTTKMWRRVFWSKLADFSEKSAAPTFKVSSFLHTKIITYRLWGGTAVAQWLRCCATNRKVAGSIPAGFSGFFIDMKFFRPHCGPGVDSASNINEYQEHFLAFSGGKSGRCVGLTTLPPSCAVVMKSGNLNFLKPSGPLQACNGFALPFLPIMKVGFS